MGAVNTVSKFVFPLGPAKVEIANLSSVDNGETYTTTMQDPKFGFFVGNKSGGAMTSTPEVAIVGRVATLNSADLSNSTGVLVIVGF